MKKKVLAAGLSAMSALVALDAFAGGIENKANMNVGYLRNPSRNTEFKRPEASFYNVAGTAYMKDGLYVEIGNQFVAKEFKHELKATGTSYNDETFVFLYPNAEVVYKHDSWAAFLNFGIHGGGGNLTYSEGTAPTSMALLALGSPEHELKVSSIVYGWQLGGAFAITDFISLGAAFRLTYGTQEMTLESGSLVFGGANGGDTIGYDASAVGFSGVFGVHAKPIQPLDITAQFSWRSKMEYELDNVKGNLAAALLQDKFRNDISPVLNLGVGYQIIDPVYVSASFNYYFNNLAKMNSALGENDYDNSWELAAGVDWDIMKALTVSLGLSYANQGSNDEANNVFNPVLDSLMIGAGVEGRPVENLTITGGLSWVKYFDQDYADGAMKLSKPFFIFFSLGLTYRFPV